MLLDQHLLSYRRFSTFTTPLKSAVGGATCARNVVAAILGTAYMKYNAKRGEGTTKNPLSKS